MRSSVACFRRRPLRKYRAVGLMAVLGAMRNGWSWPLWTQHGPHTSSLSSGTVAWWQRVDGTAATIRAHFYTLQLERQIRLDHDTRIIRVS